VASPADDDGLASFESARPRLFGVAYRMLGSVSEAEDIVQEAWFRWQDTDRTLVRDPTGFLMTIAARLAITAAQSARVRRETYVGEWLPEPIDTGADPALGAERSESVTLAVLLLLEKLTPSERGAYVLHEAFDYDYPKIAEILNTSEPNARQLVSRARKHVIDGRRKPVSPAEHERLLAAFVAAAQRGDASALETIFASDVVSRADGGGLVRAARAPIVGRAAVAKFVPAVAWEFWTGVTLDRIEVNGQAAILATRGRIGGALVTICASEEGIDQVLWFLRPSKLSGVTSPSTNGRTVTKKTAAQSS